ITLNRPEAMNSFNAQMSREFVHLWKRISEDDNINAVVLRASDCRAFSPGADIKQSRADANVLGSTFDFNMQGPGVSLGPHATRCCRPVVTAERGLCCGGAY